MPVRLSKLLLCFAAAAVKALSEKGIVHRDLKPQNILLCHDGRESPQPPDITLKIGLFASLILNKLTLTSLY